MQILILDTDDVFSESLSSKLQESGHSVAIARDLAEATNHSSSDSCDMVFLDSSCQPGMISRIKVYNPDILVVEMSLNPSIDSIIVALRQGAFDFLIKPFVDKEPLKEVLERARKTIEATSVQRVYLKRILKTFSELSFANEKIRERGYASETIELYYSQFFEDILAIELARSQRFNHNFTIISIRLDYLQDYMSQESDAEYRNQVEAVAGFLHKRMRRTDVLVRTGVNEFMIILVETPKEGGMVVVENLRQGIAAIVPVEICRSCQSEGNPPFAIGTAVYPFDGMECPDLMKKACHYQ